MEATLALPELVHTLDMIGQDLELAIHRIDAADDHKLMEEWRTLWGLMHVLPDGDGADRAKEDVEFGIWYCRYRAEMISLQVRTLIDILNIPAAPSDEYQKRFPIPAEEPAVDPEVAETT